MATFEFRPWIEDEPVEVSFPRGQHIRPAGVLYADHDIEVQIDSHRSRNGKNGTNKDWGAINDYNIFRGTQPGIV